MIISRKGFDTSPQGGGGASPILDDGRMVSLPIPDPVEGAADITYADLKIDGRTYLDLIGRPFADRPAHLDPDLVGSLRPRAPGWRGLFGQSGAAATHLHANGVGVGDLFLFFGRFRHDGRDVHAVYGHLEVDTVVKDGNVPWAPYHPHVARPDRGRPNLLYVATERLSFAPDRPGWGVFRWRPELQLTRRGQPSIRVWDLPRSTLTYHPPGRWSSDGTLVSASRGQEFVCTDGALTTWARELVTQSETWE